MYARATSGIVLSACLIMAPLSWGASKHKATTKPAATDTKVVKADKPGAKADQKSRTRSAAWHGKDWKSGATPTVRPIAYQPPTTRPWSATTTRPAGGTYTYTVPASYDYFASHYGSVSDTTGSANVMGYVPPEKTSSNAGNPFIYRRSK